MGNFAVIGYELVAELLRAGFELMEFRKGKVVDVFYFEETEELLVAIEKYLEKTY